MRPRSQAGRSPKGFKHHGSYRRSTPSSVISQEGPGPRATGVSHLAGPLTAWFPSGERPQSLQLAEPCRAGEAALCPSPPGPALLAGGTCFLGLLDPKLRRACSLHVTQTDQVGETQLAPSQSLGRKSREEVHPGTGCRWSSSKRWKKVIKPAKVPHSHTATPEPSTSHTP